MTASRWRQRARHVIAGVVVLFPPERATARAEVERAIRTAYPWGERSGHLYHCWLQERDLALEAWVAARAQADLLATTGVSVADVAMVCDVARDAVEHGRIAEARAMLAEQAPTRLARRCPTCGRAPGEECWEVDGGRDENYRLRELLVPHVSRVSGAHPGPLFGAAT